MGYTGDTPSTTIGAYVHTADVLKREQRELAARLNKTVSMPDVLERIVTEWQAFKNERRHVV